MLICRFGGSSPSHCVIWQHLQFLICPSSHQVIWCLNSTSSLKISANQPSFQKCQAEAFLPQHTLNRSSFTCCYPPNTVFYAIFTQMPLYGRAEMCTLLLPINWYKDKLNSLSHFTNGCLLISDLLSQLGQLALMLFAVRLHLSLKCLLHLLCRRDLIHFLVLLSKLRCIQLTCTRHKIIRIQLSDLALLLSKRNCNTYNTAYKVKLSRRMQVQEHTHWQFLF